MAATGCHQRPRPTPCPPPRLHPPLGFLAQVLRSTLIGLIWATWPITEARGIPSDEALVGVESGCCEQEEREWILVILVIMATDLRCALVWIMLISTEKWPVGAHQNVNRVFSNF